MEKTENRVNYYKEFVSIVNKIKIDDKFDKFLVKLTQHHYFQNFKELFQDKLWTREQKLIFILTELTKERSTCNAVIQLLEQNGYKEIAKIIEKHNKSLEPMALVDKPEIEVTTVAHPKMTLSGAYLLLKKSRGKCVIINNLEDQQHPDVYNERNWFEFRPKGLENETKRLENVFKQLLFDVIILTQLNAKDIPIKLKEIRAKITDQEDAFALFVISHGQDDSVLGYTACDYIRKINFGSIDKKDEKAIKAIEEDVIPTEDIIQIFSENECWKLKNKPKMHFFICCRVKTTNSSDNKEAQGDEPVAKKQRTLSYNRKRELSTDKGVYEVKWVKLMEPTNKKDLLLDTCVVNTCADGFETFYEHRYWGMTYFTQIFTVTLAQYACDETLIQILNRTFNRLDEFYWQELERKRRELNDCMNQLEQYQLNYIQNPNINLQLTCKTKVEQVAQQEKYLKSFELGCFAIEFRSFARRRALHFNPGYFKD